ncbi:MAG: hypothetical protein RLZZ292_3948 [Bacteroidota bacterium]
MLFSFASEGQKKNNNEKQRIKEEQAYQKAKERAKQHLICSKDYEFRRCGNENPNGNLDNSKLEDGVGCGGSGSGDGSAVGGGLSARTGRSPGAIIDNSQATGIIRINICADAEGKVTRAEFTKVGSTTSNDILIAKAIAHAKCYKFSAGKDGDCGWVTYNFRAE